MDNDEMLDEIDEEPEPGIGKFGLWHVEVPVNFVRKGDVVVLNNYHMDRPEWKSEWVEVVESYNASIHGPEHSGNWMVRFKVPGSYQYDETLDEDQIREFECGIDDVVIINPTDKEEIVYSPNGVLIRWWVNVYEIAQGYGGPEEGGWYYNTGQIQLSIPCESWEQAANLAEEVRKTYPHNKTYYSVNYSGGDYSVAVEKHKGKDFPEHTPHYE